MFFSVLCLLCLCTPLFICAWWSPAGKGLTSWLSFVVSYCEFVTFPLVSWVRCGTGLYQFLIFAPLLTFMFLCFILDLGNLKNLILCLPQILWNLIKSILITFPLASEVCAHISLTRSILLFMPLRRKVFAKSYHIHSKLIVKYNIWLKLFCNKAYQNLYCMVI